MLRRLLAACCAFGITAVAEAGPGTSIRSVSAQEAQALANTHRNRPGFRIIDIRTPGEYANGHIAGAQNIDYYARDFKNRIAALPRNDTYLIYCRSGSRSKGGLSVMRTLGFTNVAELGKGIGEWQAAGFPLER